MSIERISELVPAPAAHAVGIGSGVTGLALWSDMAKHVTLFAGAIAAILAVAGGLFYAIYWGCRSYQAVKNVVAGKNVE